MAEEDTVQPANLGETLLSKAAQITFISWHMAHRVVRVDDIIYWLKVAVGLIYGYAAALLSIQLAQGPITIILSAILLYILLSEGMLRFSRSGRRKTYLNGAGGYAGVFLVSWIIFFNLLG
ncbi:MAG: hypothetical protein QW756_05330 [Nitrososphaerota archaeon]